MSQLVTLAEPGHQLKGFIRHAETQMGKAGMEARNPQYPQRVFAERRRNMAQNALLQIRLSLPGVVQAAVGRLSDGIDGQITPQQVLFQTDLRAGMEAETAVSLAAFALGACQGILFAGLGVQEYRKIAADRFEAFGQHLIRCRTDHNPVPILDLKPQQPIPHGAAYQIDLHQRSQRSGHWARQASKPPSRLYTCSKP